MDGKDAVRSLMIARIFISSSQGSENGNLLIIAEMLR